VRAFIDLSVSFNEPEVASGVTLEHAF